MADSREIASLPEKNKNWLIFLAGLAVIALFVAANIEMPPQIDDAYISYRYARNLAQGHGLVYNIGERVEGFTNMLWTLMIATGIWLGFDPPAFSHLLALLSSAALLGTTFGFAYRTCPRWYALLVPILLVCSGPFAVWSLSGLETPFYAALAVGAFWAAYEEKWWLAGILAGLCFWARPDGGLVGLTIFGAAFFQCQNKKEWGKSLSIWLFFLASLTVFRLIYYGEFVPNTFQAKVGGIPWAQGVRYVSNFYLAGPLFVLPLALLEVKNTKLWPIWLFVIAQTLYVLSIGGDVFACSRFFMAVLPLILVVVVSASGTLKFPARCIAWAVVISLWGIFTEYIPILKERNVDKIMKVWRIHEQAGKKLAESLSKYDGPVATVAIGQLGYSRDGRILDMLGLISPEVAKRKGSRGLLVPGHQASNPDWILAQNPAVICVSKENPKLPCQIEMLEHPEFQSQYVQRGDVFVRKDLVSSHDGTENSD